MFMVPYSASYQSKPRDFYAQSVAHTHTLVEQPSEAIWGSVSFLRTLGHAARTGDRTTNLSGRSAAPKILFFVFKALNDLGTKYISDLLLCSKPDLPGHQPSEG